jgi:hypothetical protein
LLEEEGHASRRTLVAYLPHPLGIDRSVIWPTLSSNDHPMNLVKVKVGQRAEQGLA